MENAAAERLQILTKSKLMERGSGAIYDRFTRLAATILGVPVSLVSLVEKDRQYFTSHYGLPEPWASQGQTPLSHSFCQHVVSSRKPFIVADAREEAILKDNLAIPEIGVIAYLGFPLIVDNFALGSFCAIDNQPRVWTEREIEIVQELAHFVTTEIALQIEIAERQKISEQLSESEERFRTLANQAPIIIWQMDIGKGATFFNEMWHTITGLSEQESLGSGWIAAIHPADRERVREQWMQAWTENQFFQSEFRLRRKNGIVCEVIAHGAVYTDQQGTSGRSIGTLLDVTEQKELERQREAFISMATHELKTPLTVMQGVIQIAQRRLRAIPWQEDGPAEKKQMLVEEAQSFLVRCLQQMRLQQRLIDDLLDMSRLQQEQLILTLAPCDMVKITEEVVLDQQAANPQRVIVIADPLPEEIDTIADRDRIGQVLNNYLTNALKYSPSDQPVSVGVTIIDEMIKVWVQDWGPGLSHQEQQRIWQRYYQVPTIQLQNVAARSRGVSLGLGLYICQNVIECHGGQVGVDSQQGRGSIFWFTLPLHPQAGSEK